MKKNICFLLILLYPTVLFSQTPAILKKLVGGEFYATATSGITYLKNTCENRGYMEFLEYRPEFCGGLGIGYNTDFGKIGIGAKLSMCYLRSKVIDNSGSYSIDFNPLFDTYLYLSNPVYLRIKLHKSINMSVGIANNFAIYEKFVNYDKKEYRAKLDDYYSVSKYYPEVYLALGAKVYKRLSFDIEYMRTNKPYNTFEGRTFTMPDPLPQPDPEHIEYNKYQFMLSVNYQLNYKKK